MRKKLAIHLLLISFLSLGALADEPNRADVPVSHCNGRVQVEQPYSDSMYQEFEVELKSQPELRVVTLDPVEAESVASETQDDKL